MAVTTLDLTDKQGGIVDVNHDDGSIVVFGRPMRRFIIKNPLTNSDKVYYTLGKAGMLGGTLPKTEAVLDASYPFLIPGEDLEFEEPNRQPETLELLCGNTKAVTAIRVMKV